MIAKHILYVKLAMAVSFVVQGQATGVADEDDAAVNI